jgi:alkanesulfonate monooxygenase SsuD/methylene tetrahydromethanopterin reductase-like flavin-dependent oxidoreductase (luciferase family)
MDFGVTFPSKISDYNLVMLAEEVGFQQAWFFDSQMIYSDVYATMALAAHTTKKIRLATGVAVPSTRMAPVIAHSIATIAQIAPGRVELGVGNGNTARLTMGLKPLPLKKMKREIRTIQALLKGEECLHDFGESKKLIKLLHPDQGFINLKQKIPLTLSAFGEKTLAFCGAECDAHLSWNITPDALVANRKIIDESAVLHNRDPNSIPTKAIVPLAILQPGETIESERVLRSVGPFITNLLHVLCEWDEKLLPADKTISDHVKQYKKYVASLDPQRRHLMLHEGHLIFTRDDELKYLVSEIANIAAMIGTPASIIEQIKTLEERGLKHFAFQITDSPRQEIKDFAAKIIARY